MSPLILIDGSGFIFRAFYALPPLTRSDGTPVNAVYGFCNMLMRALLDHKESEMYVLTMIQWQLRNLLLAKVAPAGMSPAELAKASGMSPYVAGRMMSAQGSMDERLLAVAYRAAATCEIDIKTGRLKAEVAVEQLIYSASSRFRRLAA